MTTLELLAAFFTGTGLACYIMLTQFFSRNLKDPLLRALFIFFLINALVFASFFGLEVIMHVSVVDPVYGAWRPVIFRGLQSTAVLWLLWVLTHK